jgi:beta-glucosidase
MTTAFDRKDKTEYDFRASRRFHATKALRIVRAAIIGFAATLPAATTQSALCEPASQTVALPARPASWMNPELPPDERANRLQSELTRDEQLQLVMGYLGRPFGDRPKPDGAVGSAGYVPGIPRLGVPALQETDASLGVTNPMKVRPGDFATALPSGLAIAAGFDQQAAFEAGAMIGQEARRKGFNVLLAGGVNLTRDPRNGRNFEYLGEDPLLAGTLAAENIRGIQEQHVLSTIKHFALNDQETARFWANAVIDEGAMRESDLLAFELAIERSHPGAVICSYNLINGDSGCDNKRLLVDILKKEWRWPGFVMSDWGGVYGTSFALHGLDQESASTYDQKPYFGEPLRDEIANGWFPVSRLSDMVHRILRSMFAAGLFDRPPVKSAIDYDADGDVAQRVAENGIVLLKNAGPLLPLIDPKRIAVIGCYASRGVLSGGGSSQVTAPGDGFSVPMAADGLPLLGANMMFHASSPRKALAMAAPGAEVRFDDGRYISSAAKLARWADVAIVFACQWTTEGVDLPDLSLPDRQDELIEAVAAANPKTVVVLETGGPVLMPWLEKVAAVVEAWYPGSRGGEAIANVLLGRVNPSGRLPMTFPADIAQTPRPVLPGSDLVIPPIIPGSPPPVVQPFEVRYTEGSDVGYRWFAKKGLKPLFPFGFGLSYTTFEYGNLKIVGGRTLTVEFDVKNTGAVGGADVPQVYLTSTPGERLLRLIGFSRVMLAPGQTGHVSVSADPRLLARFDVAAHRWRVRAGRYGVMVGPASGTAALTGSARVAGAFIKP